MKKMSVILAVVMMSASAFASPVPADKLESYKQAVYFALASVNLKCQFTPKTDHWIDGQSDSYELKALIAQATEADLDETGAQPVLTFNYSGDYVQSIAITTSTDYKSIVGISFAQFSPSPQQVNIGTIVSPNMVTKIVQVNPMSAVCR